MSKLFSLTKKGMYVPWQRPPLGSDAKVRSQNHSLPSDVCTCWELNFLTDNNHLESARPIPSFGACALFEADKAFYAHLHMLSSNKEASYRYHCLTPWVGPDFFLPSIMKRKPDEPPGFLSPTGDATPNKKRKASPRVLHIVARLPVSPGQAPRRIGSPPTRSIESPKTAGAPAVMTSPSATSSDA